MSATTFHPAEVAVQDITHVYNSEVILDPHNPVTGRNAEKILQIKDRSVWYPCGQLIIPTAIDQDFLGYVESFGKETEVIVPPSVDPENLAIRDGKDDEAFKAAIGPGKWVESYVVQQWLGRHVEALGGEYFVRQVDGATERANDKAQYKTYMEGIVGVPEGSAIQGIDNITEAVLERLATDGRAFVRHTASGGGYGNRRFDQINGHRYTAAQVRTKLEGEHPELWRDGTALVEKYLDLMHSPAASFNNSQDSDTQGFAYDNLQITKGSEYCGSWSPVPPEICSVVQLADIGSQTAKRLHDVGYNGPGNNDFGTLADGTLVGMEINGRMTGVRHAIEIGHMLFKRPWAEWRAAGHVIKTLDYFELKGEMDFNELRATLGAAGLLASARSPYGVVITIPPHGTIAGIQVQEQGYRRTEGLYQEIVQLVGAPGGNRHDNPYIPR